MLNLRTNSLLIPPAGAGAEDQQLSHRHVLNRQGGKREMLHRLNVANAARELGALPEMEATTHCVMRGNFHGWDMVPAVLRLAEPATIAHLIVATLGFNRQNAVELLAMLDDGRIHVVTFICSVYFQRSCPEEFSVLSAGLTQRRQRLAAVRSHAKVMGFHMTDGRRFVWESSANLRSCRNIEQFALTQSPELYEFHRTWIEEVLNTTGGTK